MEVKSIYIIAGPNGSGKTTFAKTFLPEYAKCDRFINADLIASGLSPFSPQQAALKSGRLVLEQIKEYAEDGVSFGFETTMSGVTHLRRFRDLKKKGYAIYIFFLWLPDVKLSIARVQDRVSQGGHNVPIKDIRRRFRRSVENFLRHYRTLADKWVLFDNAEAKPKIIVKKYNAHPEIFDKEQFEMIRKKAGVSL